MRSQTVLLKCIYTGCLHTPYIHRFSSPLNVCLAYSLLLCANAPAPWSPSPLHWVPSLGRTRLPPSARVRTCPCRPRQAGIPAGLAFRHSDFPLSPSCVHSTLLTFAHRPKSLWPWHLLRLGCWVFLPLPKTEAVEGDFPQMPLRLEIWVLSERLRADAGRTHVSLNPGFSTQRRPAPSRPSSSATGHGHSNRSPWATGG